MTVHAPAERPRILAELTERPGQTAYEVAAQLGYAKPDSMAVADVVYRMWRRGVLVHGTAFRPHIGRKARIFYVAPPGTPPLAETPEQAARRRAKDRRDKANERARAAERAGRPRSDHRTTTKTSLGPASDEAACRTADPDLFFGPDGERAADHDRRVAQAKAVCFSCPIRRRCLEVAQANRETFGVWGGVDFELRRPSQATRPDVAASSRA
jgi:WhiB family redox-sensing transcriptional regulator